MAKLLITSKYIHPKYIFLCIVKKLYKNEEATIGKKKKIKKILRLGSSRGKH